MAHKPYYKILGLDAPPKDRREVKLAYSKQLKVTRPEDDPDGFMQLRDAHDQALQQLRWAAQTEPQPVDARETVTFEDMIEPLPIEEDGEHYTTYAMGRTQSLEAPTLTLENAESPTGYSIGPTPSLNAPLQPREPKPAQPAILEDITDILQSHETRNNRESWNTLFRKARQLDIDEYVDFEALLLNRILHVHGFFGNDPLYETPEKMPKLISPSITASLFKTMAWDQVGKFDYNQTYQINWLERRMGLYKANQTNTDYLPHVDAKDNSWIWIVIPFAIIGFQLLKAFTNQ